MTLPLTAGPAASDALHAWSDAPRVAAATLLWLAWAVGLLTTLAPRPQTLTAVRVIAPTFVLVAIIAALGGRPSALAGASAVAATLVAAGFVSSHDIAIAAANSIAYGDELRFLLRVPPALFFGPLPVARLLVAASVVAPVLLLADGQIVAGLACLVVGVGLVYVLARSLNSLSRRWAVLVPAGFVVVDALTLADPVLFPREHVRAMTPLAPGAVADASLDLRLGATLGSLTVEFAEVAELVRSGRGRRGGDTARTERICIAVVRRDELLDYAAGRRLPVR